jgi:hypothetical protein
MNVMECSSELKNLSVIETSESFLSENLEDESQFKFYQNKIKNFMRVSININANTEQNYESVVDDKNISRQKVVESSLKNKRRTSMFILKLVFFVVLIRKIKDLVMFFVLFE